MRSPHITSQWQQGPRLPSLNLGSLDPRCFKTKCEIPNTKVSKQLLLPEEHRRQHRDILGPATRTTRKKKRSFWCATSAPTPSLHHKSMGFQLLILITAFVNLPFVLQLQTADESKSICVWGWQLPLGFRLKAQVSLVPAAAGWSCGSGQILTHKPGPPCELQGAVPQAVEFLVWNTKSIFTSY